MTESIGPGIGGFVSIFVLTVGMILLVRDMNRRVQRLRYRRIDGDGAAPGDVGRGTDDGVTGDGAAGGGDTGPLDDGGPGPRP